MPCLCAWLLAKVGCRWASHKLFPWKALPTKRAGSGVVCHNFPDSVPFPGEDCQRSKSSSKGISDLSLADCSILIVAFNNTSQNGDSDSDIPITKGKGKETIVIADSDKSQEVSPAVVKRRHLPECKGRRRQANEAFVTLVDAVKDEMQDISSPSGSEFLPEKTKAKGNEVASNADEDSTTSNNSNISDKLTRPISHKRKAMVDKSQWPVKKRVIVEVVHPSFMSKQKGKVAQSKKPEGVSLCGHGYSL